jgi:excisionase family DNA binding protein
MPKRPETPGNPLKPLAVTIPTAGKIIGVGRSTIYELLRDGTLASVKVRNRRLINFASLERLTKSP